MATFITQSHNEILSQALRKVEKSTPLTATSPGSILRAFIEAITTQLGDYYDLLDHNMSQAVLSTATGRSLDLLGAIYNVERKQLNDDAAIEASKGAFYFFIDTPYHEAITIPQGTRIFTNEDTLLGRQFTYITTATVVIPVGETRVFASIRALSPDSAFTAGSNTLVQNDFDETAAGLSTTIRNTNPKAIPSSFAFESDRSYRTRIIKEIRVTHAGTAEAVRFAGLSIEGVRDIRIRSASYGLGSFDLLIVPENTIDTATVIQRVSDHVRTVRPVGVRMIVRAPTLKPINITATLIITENNRGNSIEPFAIRRAREAARRYINTLSIGQTLVYNQLIQEILTSSNFIKDVNITELTVNGQPVLRRNVKAGTDELLIPGSLTFNTVSAVV